MQVWNETHATVFMILQCMQLLLYMCMHQTYKRIYKILYKACLHNCKKSCTSLHPRSYTQCKSANLPSVGVAAGFWFSETFIATSEAHAIEQNALLVQIKQHAYCMRNPSPGLF